MQRSKKVVAISRIPVADFPASHRVGVNQIVVADSDAWESVPFHVPGSLSLTSKTEDKQPIFTAELSFDYCGDAYSRALYAYKIKLADGTYYIIGSDERPYAVAETSRSLSSGSSDKQTEEVKITYSSALQIPIL